MKKLLSLPVLAALTAMVFAGPQAKFAKESHDFGKINEGDGKVTYIFDVKNTGDAPLIITQVETSCGCTAREYTKEPIAPGENGEVKVTYNPAGRPGPFKKTITVNSNASKKVVLSIKGEVTPKPKKK